MTGTVVKAATVEKVARSAHVHVCSTQCREPGSSWAREVSARLLSLSLVLNILFHELRKHAAQVCPSDRVGGREGLLMC